MIRLLLLGLFFYIGMRLFSALGRFFFAGSAPPPARTREGEEMVRDPQCGTFLPRSDAVSRTVDGQLHYFCSTGCRDAFRGRS